MIDQPLEPLDETVLMNKHKMEMVDKVVALQEAIDSALFTIGKEDLYKFNKHVLEVEKNKSKLTSFHREMCHFVTDDMHRKKLLLVPRGHLKSTLITIGYSLFRIINNPNIRILILNATWQMAVDFLTEIKRNLQANEKLIRIFGDLSGGATEWSNDRITLKRTDMNIKGPTVWATGIESNLVGSHPDLIIMDDVVNRDNTGTHEQIEKVILRYKDALDLLEPGGQIIVIGTRWSEVDFYSWIMDKETGVIQSFDSMVREAYQGNLLSGEDFSPIWPEKYNLKTFQDLQREKGWFEFSAQYLNNPIPDEAATFKRGDFQRFDLEDVRGKNLTKAILVDPAIEVGVRSDYSAIVVVGMDEFKNIFVLDLDRGRWLPNELIEKIFQYDDRWHPHAIGIETIAYQRALAYSIREHMNEKRQYLPIKELRHHDQSKEKRIGGMQPFYEARRVYHPKGNKFTTYLEEELAAFPRGKHDDFCFAAGTKVMTINGNKNIEKIRKGDRVLTRNGYKLVIESKCTGIRNTIKRVGITATPDHPFITRSGIKRFDKLKPSDRIYMWNEKRLFIEEKSFIDTLSPQEDIFGYISGVTMFIKEIQFLSIGQYGLKNLVKFLQNTLSIIKTEIRSIMTFLIWNYLLNLNTCLSMLLSQTEFYSQRKISNLPESMLPFGMEVRKERNGTAFMQRNHGRKENLIHYHVLGVNQNLSHYSATPSIVPADAMEDTGGLPTYNLLIEGSHEFFANGILVHNCDALSFISEVLIPPRKRESRYHHTYLY